MKQWRAEALQVFHHFQQERIHAGLSQTAKNFPHVLLMEEQVTDTLLTMKLGILLGPRTGLGQQRRSSRVQSRHGATNLHDALIQTVLAIDALSDEQHKAHPSKQKRTRSKDLSS
jgi:hypothetical protein